ncbi:MAG TPA: FadR family transcriptional regulator [Chloroflexi bacterium]|nr:FadR family transcriptional regulator [Chloroflexota bacterium]
MSDSSFGPIKKQTLLVEEITSRILSLIKERELSPGDRLPPERELAVMLNVSRASLREALRALFAMNILEMRQGDGTYVTSLEPQQLVQHLEFVFSLDDSTFIQLFEARKIVEVGIVALAAQRITDSQITLLEEKLQLAERSLHDPEAFLNADLELHKIIIEAARNPILDRFMSSISQLGLASRSRTVNIPGILIETIEDHKAIVEAIKQHDPDAASRAMLIHLNHVEDRLSNLSVSEQIQAPDSET